ncbi:MAG: hypothetical protein KVP17_003473 [Porospora cf. gigantea B]|uniref:uncharacterized protein n=1 Tax=Porospora cf. gigantea B TaxID=2853592 RepID=UPI003571CA15|nr:MAG: hypothetical protein KVP17_003473 [Porospora cf. gigantea B]
MKVAATNSTPVILDVGTHSVKIGQAGSDAPQLFHPSAYGLPAGSREGQEMLIGELDSRSNQHARKLSALGISPTHRSMLKHCPSAVSLLCDGGRGSASQNWVRSAGFFPLDPLTKIDKTDLVEICSYDHATKTHNLDLDGILLLVDEVLGADRPDTPPVVVPEPTEHDAGFRHRMVELLYEGCASPALFLQKRASLSMYAAAYVSGVCLDVGASHSSSCAVVEGYVAPHSVRTSAMGGDLMCRATLEHIQLENDSVELWPGGTTSALPPLYRYAPDGTIPLPLVTPSYAQWSMKTVCEGLVASRLAFAPPIVEDDSGPESYQLPDGSEISFDADMCQALPTLHFVPNNWTEEYPWLQDFRHVCGADDLVWGTVGSLSQADKAASASRVLVCGGASMLPGFVPSLLSFVSAYQHRAADDGEEDVFSGLQPSTLPPGAVKGCRKWRTVYNHSASPEVVLQAIESTINVPNTWRVIASEDWVTRQFSSYIGGSLLGCLGVFSRQMAVPISTYFETGAEGLCARYF